MDLPDSTTAKRNIWMCLTDFARLRLLRIFKRRSRVRERDVYPRVELPRYDLDFEYVMNHKRRGFAVIFNHHRFEDNRLSVRTGTDVDSNRLESALKNLRFDVKVCNDFRLQSILTCLRKGKNLKLLQSGTFKFKKLF